MSNVILNCIQLRQKGEKQEADNPHVLVNLVEPNDSTEHMRRYQIKEQENETGEIPQFLADVPSSKRFALCVGLANHDQRDLWFSITGTWGNTRIEFHTSTLRYKAAQMIMGCRPGATSEFIYYEPTKREREEIPQEYPNCLDLCVTIWERVGKEVETSSDEVEVDLGIRGTNQVVLSAADVNPDAETDVADNAADNAANNDDFNSYVLRRLSRIGGASQKTEDSGLLGRYHNSYNGDTAHTPLLLVKQSSDEWREVSTHPLQIQLHDSRSTSSDRLNRNLAFVSNRRRALATLVAQLRKNYRDLQEQQGRLELALVNLEGNGNMYHKQRRVLQKELKEIIVEDLETDTFEFPNSYLTTLCASLSRTPAETPT